MSLIEWLLFGPRFRQHQDTYALTRAATLSGLVNATRQALKLNHAVVWLAHFESTFVELESVLQESNLEFEVLTRVATPQELFTNSLRADSQAITLTLADMLRPSSIAGAPEKREGHLSIMVGERHPLIDKDNQLASFARQIPSRTSIGYFISMEDPVVARFISPTIVQILENLGMGSHDLISSHMVTKSIRKSLMKLRATLVTPTKDAGSPAEWLELNASRDR